MITYLRGHITESLPNQITVDVQGVGYKCLVPLTTYDKLSGSTGEVKILTHLHIAEDKHTLFGFATNEERDLFKLLIDRVGGIGPKTALSVLSGTTIADFKDNVVRGDITALSRIKGVAKKTAERIVLELKDKVGIVQTWKDAKSSDGLVPDPSQAAQTDAVLALISLGYKQAEAQKAVQAVVKRAAGDAAKITANTLIMDALRTM